ncbi:MAG: hypothetical protein LUH18_07370 [Oscillospiraceae bacterium]|nr:hypothetical protein [Oscillospiraceae bacterium]
MNTAELSPAEYVGQKQNKEEMLYRSLVRIIQLYTDKSHFIYELLQNAEDAGASKISFVQYDDRLEVLHNSRSFTNENLYALCDVGESDKTTNLNQIGEFGVGFKSVYGICKEVLLYSHPTENEISQGLKRFSYKITDFTDLSDIEDQDFSDEYTTKFVFSYAIGEKFSSFTYYLPLKNTISKRLQNLGVTTLLFLKNLKSINYEIDMEDVKAKGSYSLERLSVNDHCTLIRGVGIGNENDDGNKIPSYLVFSTPIDVSNSQRTVDIAFPVTKTDEGKYIFRKANNSNISVYFPTGTESKLNFIVQGSFRTAPNRSDVPADNEDNKKLANIAADLLCESIRELAERNELNYSLIEILPLDESAFENYALFKVMYERMCQLFSTEELIPYDGGYTNAKSALIARGKDLSTVFTDELITELWNDGREYHWLPANLNSRYGKAYEFLTEKLLDKFNVKAPTLKDLRDKFVANPKFMYNRDDEWLIQFYDLYTKRPYAGEFEFSGADSNMSYVPIIKTDDGRFVPAFKRNSVTYGHIQNVFPPCENESTQNENNLVNKYLYDKCRDFFSKILGLHEPNECELFMFDFKKRYKDVSNIEDTQYKKDVKALLRYYDYNYGKYRGTLDELFFNYLPIRCFQSQRDPRYIRINKDDNSYKGRLFFPVSEDGLNIEVYYRGVRNNNIYVDFDFYDDIILSYSEMDKLKKNLNSIGFKDDISIDSDKRDGNRKPGESDKSPSFKWAALDGFAWALTLDHLTDVVAYIQRDSGCDDASNTKKKKSSIIFKFLKGNENRLSGKIRHKKDGSVELVDEKARIITQLTPAPRRFMRGGIIEELPYRLLYTKDGRFVAPCEITKYELDETLYGKVDEDSPLYDLLGFKKDARREKDEAIKKKYSVLSDDEKSKYLEMALEERGIAFYEFDEFIRQRRNQNTQSNQSYLYAENDDFDFPSYKVRNWESLRKHVAEVVYTADSVKYEYVMRHIRTSKPESQRAYLKSMYKIDYSEKCACQMCHKPTSSFYACQLEKKPTIELDPMHLCLCPNCASKFQQIRNDESDDFLKRIRRLSNSEMESPECVKIYLTHDAEIWFNQTHAAEIREILALQDESGVGSDVIDDTKNSNSEKSSPVVITDVVEEVPETESKSQPEKANKKNILRKVSDFNGIEGKRVYHSGIKKYAEVKACRGNTIELIYEDPPYEIHKFSIEAAIEKKNIEIVDE